VTASIITEYLIASKPEFDSNLATALFYAIKSETGGCRAGSARSKPACGTICIPRGSEAPVNIENARVSREYFKIIHKALEHCGFMMTW
jgi:hypothetical protein